MRSAGVIWLTGLSFLVAGGCNPSPQIEGPLPPGENTVVTPPPQPQPELEPEPPPPTEIEFVRQFGPEYHTRRWGPSTFVWNEVAIGVDDNGVKRWFNFHNLDLTELPEQASSAQLELFCSRSGEGGVEGVTVLQGDGWDEELFEIYTDPWSHATTGVAGIPGIGATWGPYDHASVYLSLLPPPQIGQWYSIPITDLYNRWQSGEQPNYGFLLVADPPTYGKWSAFYGYHYSADASLRPKLTITAPATTPVVSFYCKMPLPGGKEWLLTTEAGGGDCASQEPPPPSHLKENYYSLDFAPWSRVDGVVRLESDVPVYAAAGGIVVVATETEDIDNGYFVVIDHDYDGNPDTGFTTRYLHLKGRPLVNTNDTIILGQQIGVVGNTPGHTPDGKPMGTHLHFGVRYENSGAQDVSVLAQVKLEGLHLTEYKTRCDTSGTRTAYYPSSNRP